MDNPTDKQIGLLHHTLGVTPERREPYRNHFVAGQGHHDQANLEALEALGLMARSPTPKFCDPDDVVFRCTDAGRVLALDKLPQPPKRSRYQQFMHDDYGHSFAEWLGINRPEVESNYRYGKDARYRYVRKDYRRHIEISGEWMPTKKAAKASYKEAMQARRSAQKGCPA